MTYSDYIHNIHASHEETKKGQMVQNELVVLGFVSADICSKTRDITFIT